MGTNDYAAKSAYHGEIAERYEDHRTVEPVWAVEQEFVRAWSAVIQPQQSILDIPTGTGRFVDFFLARGARVHAWDISEDMLAQIRQRFGGTVPANLDLKVGDAERLSLTDGAVDFVISWRLFHLLPAGVMGRVLAEFNRVCRGVIVVQVFAVRPAGYRESPWRRLKEVLRPAWRALRSKLGTKPRLPWGHITSYSHREEELLAAIQNAGLTITETRTLEQQPGLANRVYFLTRAAK